MTSLDACIVRAALLAVVVAGGSGPAPADPSPKPDLRPETVAAFEKYVKDVEAEADLRVAGKPNFLWLDDSPARLARAKRGEVVSVRTAGDGPVKVPNGLIHDFIGGVFIPRATAAQTLAFVQDYDHHKDFYGPEVAQARIVRRDDEHFVVFMRLRKGKMGVTAVLDTTHDARFYELDPGRWHSRSRTVDVREVENHDSPNERERPAGYGAGYMWALNSYWRFAERDGGTYVECRAVSLSRAIPGGWLGALLIGPIVNDLPKDSLENTLRATRAGVLKRIGSSK